jgi:hypothetical protein
VLHFGTGFPLLIACAVSAFRLDAQARDTRPELLALGTIELHKFGPARVLLVDTVVHVGEGDVLSTVHAQRYATLAVRRLPTEINSIPVVPAGVEDRVLGPDTAHVSLIRLVDRTGPSGTPVVVALVFRASRPAIVMCVVRRVGTGWRVEHAGNSEHRSSIHERARLTRQSDSAAEAETLRARAYLILDAFEQAEPSPTWARFRAATKQATRSSDLRTINRELSGAMAGLDRTALAHLRTFARALRSGCRSSKGQGSCGQSSRAWADCLGTRIPRGSSVRGQHRRRSRGAR